MCTSYRKILEVVSLLNIGQGLYHVFVLLAYFMYGIQEHGIECIGL